MTAVNEMTLAEYEAAVRLTWSEAEIQTDTIRRAREHGYLVAHFRAVKQQRRDGSTRYLTPVQADGEGFFDLFLARESDGRQLLIELKAKGGRLSPAQKRWYAAAARGSNVYVWNERTPVSEIESVLA